MTPALVIFDCDGVLVDSEAITTAAIVDAMAAEGLTWTAARVLDAFRGGQLDDVCRTAERELGRPLQADFIETFRADLFERLRTKIQPIPGVEAALDEITIPICVASNGPRAKMEATLGTTGLMQRFEGHIFSAYEVNSFKPEPGLFLHAAAAMGAEPARCVVVEDSDTGVRAAVAAGMRVLAYTGHGFEMHAEGAEPFDDMRMLPRLIG